MTHFRVLSPDIWLEVYICVYVYICYIYICTYTLNAYTVFTNLATVLYRAIVIMTLL